MGIWTVSKYYNSSISFVNFNFIFPCWLLIKLQTLLESLDELFNVLY